MKKVFVIVCLLLPVLSLQARAIQEDYKNADEKSRVSYAFGMLMASNLKSIELEFDYDAFANGVKAMMENLDLQFSDQEAMEIVDAAFQRSMEKTAEENKRREIEFLAENSKKQGIITTSSGLQYEVITEGSESKPSDSDVVKVHYEGKLIDGTVFDSSYDRGEPIEFPLNGVIAGWTEGVQLMGVGSKYKFFIPSELGFGSGGAGPIPPNSVLIFEVELLDIIN